MKLNKICKQLLISSVVIMLTACGVTKQESKISEDKTITVVASPVPHAEILEKAKTLLEKEGYTLNIKVVNDYVTPNEIVDRGEADANYFQHTPYLEKFNEEHKTNEVSVGNVHIEPMAIYSKKYRSIKELPEGATILASTSIADQGRFLSFFTQAGLVTLKEGVDPVKATFDDIKENKKHFKFEAKIAPELLVQTYNNNEGDAVIINSNFAIDAGLNPTTDSIALESSDSPYANLLAVKKGNENNEKIKKLISVLQSDEIDQFITDTWKDGSVIPAK